MDEREIARRRLASVRLNGPPFATAEQVVGWFGAVQAQEYAPAMWSLGQRTAGIGEERVRRAFAEGTVLRTHVLRPTWHFVLPADIRWLLALTGPRVHAQNAYYYRQLGLDAALLRRCTDLLTAVLRGGNHLTRGQLGAALAAAGVEATGMRLAYLVMYAELEGVICSGAPAGKQQTYALLAERAPQAVDLGRPEALRELVVRYFTSHGPATVKDLRWWSSVTAADIRVGIELAGSRLQQDVVDGVAYWSAPATGGAPPPSPTGHLVQGYDEYVVAFKESTYVLDLSGAARGLTARRTFPLHLVILDGQLVGHWKRAVTRDTVDIEIQLYAPVNPAQARALAEAAERHGAFLGRRVVTSTTVVG